MNSYPSSSPMRPQPGPLGQLHRHFILAVLLLFCWMGSTAHAERRVALVIGNSAYAQEALKNPVNDARDMRVKLQTLGFAAEDIVYREDLKISEIGATLREFGGKLKGDAVALVFYAGHGVQIEGENYLPAVDAQIVGEEDVPLKSLHVSMLMKLLADGKTRLNLVFLDACRNNPYARSLRDSTRGLAKVEAPSGTLITYATRPGSVAADGKGRNGVFTAELLKNISAPGLDVELMLRRVVRGVQESTGGKQTPWKEGSIDGDFYFATVTQPPVPAVVVPPTPAPPAAATLPSPKDVAEHGAPPGQVFKDCAECPELVVLPRGSFTMGSPDSEAERGINEGPTRVVRIDYPLAVGRFEVTQGQWKALMGSNPSEFNTCGDNCPVEKVNWNDAQEFVKKLSARTGQKYRLLTEAEWEYAARAGTRTPFSTGHTISSDQANFYGSLTYNGSKEGVYRKRTVPVGSFPPNAFGLYDMHGNVWEWVQDTYHENYKGASADGSAWESGGDATPRVYRGGGWGIGPDSLRSAVRNRVEPKDRGSSTGFRVARTF